MVRGVLVGVSVGLGGVMVLIMCVRMCMKRVVVYYCLLLSPAFVNEEVFDIER